MTTRLTRSLDELKRDILEALLEENTKRTFWESIWLELFQIHARFHPLYSIFIKRLGIDPSRITGVDEIPYIHISVFRYHDVAFEPERPPLAIFRSSGTTGGMNTRSRHPVFDFDLYNTASPILFRRFVLCDIDSILMLILAPSYHLNKESSLAYMLHILFSQFARPGSIFAWSENGPDYEKALKWLQSHSQHEPICIFATALALYYFLQFSKKQGMERLPLHPGSRIVETGGFKGIRVNLNKEMFYKEISDFFEVPLSFLTSEYGMTELTSQLYDNTLYSGTTGAFSSRRFIAPPWLHVTILDPVTWKPRPPHTEGPLAFIDPLNLYTIPFFVTEDRGTIDETGIVLKGRLEHAPLRGCSLLAE